jgi:hypothetical protein
MKEGPMTNSTSANSIYNICNYDMTGFCTPISKSLQSFFEQGTRWTKDCYTEILKKDGKPYDVCLGEKSPFGTITAAASSMANTPAPLIRSALYQIFNIYTLPELPKSMAPTTNETSLLAVTALIGSLVTPYFISSKNPSLSSLSSGGLLGAGVSLLFGQDPKVGALAGAVSKLVIDKIGNYMTAPLKKIYDGAEKTLRPYAKAANALITAGLAAGVAYHFNTLTELVKKNPLTAIGTALATGSHFHSLWQVYQLKGALSFTASIVSFCVSHAHYPLIAYLSLAAQSHSLQAALLNKFSEAPLTYAGIGVGALMILGLSYTEKTPPPVEERQRQRQGHAPIHYGRNTRFI